MRKIIIDYIAKRELENLYQELKKEFKHKKIKFINNIHNPYLQNNFKQQYNILSRILKK